VKFNQKHFPVGKPFGIKYGFYLEDSIDKRDEEGKVKYVGEYLIIFEEFVKIAKEYDLHFVEKKNFNDLLTENLENSNSKRLFQIIVKDLSSANREQQWEIIQLYMMFCFRKGKEEDSKNYKPFLKTFDKNTKLFKDLTPELLTTKFD